MWHLTPRQWYILHNGWVICIFWWLYADEIFCWEIYVSCFLNIFLNNAKWPIKAFDQKLLMSHYQISHTTFSSIGGTSLPTFPYGASSNPVSDWVLLQSRFEFCSMESQIESCSPAVHFCVCILLQILDRRTAARQRHVRHGRILTGQSCKLSFFFNQEDAFLRILLIRSRRSSRLIARGRGVSIS